MLNFPPSPSVNDVYTSGGRSWVFNGIGWAPTGAQGPMGDQGPVGDKGPMGDQGPAGPTGSQGAQGPVGDKGAVGDKGPTGDQGPAGSSAIGSPLRKTYSPCGVTEGGAKM